MTPAHVQFTITSYPNLTFTINLVNSIFSPSIYTFHHRRHYYLWVTSGYISLAMLRSGSLALVYLLLCAPRVSALLDSSSIYVLRISHQYILNSRDRRGVSIRLVSLGFSRAHTLTSPGTPDVSVLGYIFSLKETRATQPHDVTLTHYCSQH